MADSTVTIGADISEIRRELAKLPNLSAEAAQQTLIQIEKAVVKAEKAAKKTAQRVIASNKAAARAIKGTNAGVANSFKGTSQGLSSIAMQLPDVASGLQQGTNAMTIFVQQGLQVVQVNMTTTIKLFKALKYTLGPVALAVGALAAAFSYFKGKLEESTEAQEAARAKLEKLIPLYEKAADAKMALAVATGAMTAAEGALMKVERQRSAAVKAATAEETANIKAIEEKRTALIRKMDMVREGSHGRETAVFKKKVAQLAEYDQQLEAANYRVANSTRVVNANSEAQADLVVVLDEQSTAAEKAAAADKRRTAALTAANALASAAAAIQDVITSGLSDEDQARVGIMDKMVAMNALLAEYPGLAASVGEALGVLEQQYLAVGVAVADAVDNSAALAKVQAIVVRGLSDTDQAVAKVLSEMSMLDDILVEFPELSAAVADAMAQLTTELDALGEAGNDDNLGFFARLRADFDESDLGKKWAEFVERFEKGALVARAAVGGIGAAVSGVVGGFDKFLQTVGGFSISDLGAVAMEGSITRDVLDAEGNVTGTETIGPGQVVEEMVAGGTAAVATFVSSIPQVVDALIAATPKLFRAAEDAIGPLVDTAIDALPGLIDSVVKAAPALVQSIIEEVPALFSAILAELPTLIIELGEGIGDIITSVLEAVPVIVADLIAALPAIVTAINLALPSILTKLTVALLKLPGILVEELIENVVQGVQDVIAEIKTIVDVGFVPYFKDLLAKIGPVIKAWFTDLFGVGATAGDAQSFGDTPGAVSVGLQGLQARFAPGDTVVAAQDPQELLRQAQQAAGGNSTEGQRVVLDIQEGHLAFDRLFKTNIRGGGSLSTINAQPVGRRSIYG